MAGLQWNRLTVNERRAIEFIAHILGIGRRRLQHYCHGMTATQIINTPVDVLENRTRRKGGMN